VKVLDLTRVLAGPYCAMILADLGADVIKVEGPGGDETRRWGPPFVGGTATYYFGANRNKWGVMLDLATATGRERLDMLLRDADVVMHNFTGATAERLGVDAARVAEVNPGAVHLTISGFGPDEPERRGFDLVVQALGGIMAITGESDRDPVKVGVPIADLTAGLYAFGAISTALFARQATGRGTALHVSLYDATLSLLANHAAGWFLASDRTGRMGTEHPHVAPYGVYGTGSGSLVIAAGTDSQFLELCLVLDRPELAADARFASNGGRVAHRDELRAELERALSTAPADAWATRLDARGIPNGAVRGVPEALTAPEASSIRTIIDAELGPMPLAMTPIRVDGRLPEPYLAPPSLGAHDELIFDAEVTEPTALPGTT
jgi:crotonobetainyl-CoA:carnitine CoA-transferase CaiB-like acyl-CoA transferase